MSGGVRIQLLVVAVMICGMVVEAEPSGPSGPPHLTCTVDPLHPNASVAEILVTNDNTAIVLTVGDGIGKDSYLMHVDDNCKLLWKQRLVTPSNTAQDKPERILFSDDGTMVFGRTMDISQQQIIITAWDVVSGKSLWQRIHTSNENPILIGVDPITQNLVIALYGLSHSTATLVWTMDPRTGNTQKILDLRRGQRLVPPTFLNFAIASATPSSSSLFIITAQYSAAGSAWVVGFDRTGNMIWNSTTPAFNQGNVVGLIGSGPNSIVVVVGDIGLAAVSTVDGQLMWACSNCDGKANGAYGLSLPQIAIMPAAAPAGLSANPYDQSLLIATMGLCVSVYDLTTGTQLVWYPQYLYAQSFGIDTATRTLYVTYGNGTPSGITLFAMPFSNVPTGSIPAVKWSAPLLVAEDAGLDAVTPVVYGANGRMFVANRDGPAVTVFN